MANGPAIWRHAADTIDAPALLHDAQFCVLLGKPYREIFTYAERDRFVRQQLQHVEILRQTPEDSIKAIADVIEMRDPCTAGHQRRVWQPAAAIGPEPGLQEETIHGIGLAAMVQLHERIDGSDYPQARNGAIPAAVPHHGSRRCRPAAFRRETVCNWVKQCQKAGAEINRRNEMFMATRKSMRTVLSQGTSPGAR